MEKDPPRRFSAAGRFEDSILGLVLKRRCFPLFQDLFAWKMLVAEGWTVCYNGLEGPRSFPETILRFLRLQGERRRLCRLEGEGLRSCRGKEGIERIYEFMKKTFIWALTLTALCAVFTLTAPKSQAAEIRADGTKDLREFLKSANDGDTIILDANCYVNDETSKDAPWVIDKAVTFRGGEIAVRMGGIILNKDVTFQGTRFTFQSYVRHGIMANGYTLTLDGVTCASGGRPIHLFCGGFYTEPGGAYGSTPGSGGKIVIRGKTSLASKEGVGNIYAGNLCLGGMTGDVSTVHGPANTFAGDPEIVIEAEMDSELGSIYAGGAEEKIPEGAVNGKDFLTDPDAYKVGGTVRVRLHASTVDYVNGLGAAGTHVTYTDTRDNKYLMDSLGVYRVSSLTVESGYVSPKADSSFVDGASLAVEPGAKLGLEQMGNVTVGSFSGGGRLVLGEQHTLTVTGAVDGETEVQIGKELFVPKENFSYIQAAQSTDRSFTLIPPSNRPDLGFVKNGSVWTVMGGQSPVDPIIVEKFSFESKDVSILEDAENKSSVDLTLLASFLNNRAPLQYLSFLPLEIRVNGMPAVPSEYIENNEAFPYYVCETQYGSLALELTGSEPESLTVYSKAYMEGNYSDPIPDGVYMIEVIIPGEHTQLGVPLSDTMTLTVGESGSLPDTGVIGGISPGKDNTVRVYLAAPGGPVKAGTVMAAVYDANGRLVSFGSVPVSEEGSTSVVVPVSLSGGKAVQAFLTDAMKPLCQSQSALLP